MSQGARDGAGVGRRAAIAVVVPGHAGAVAKGVFEGDVRCAPGARQDEIVADYLGEGGLEG